MPWFQKTIELEPRPRGFHLITAEVVRGLSGMAGIRTGLLHVFIQHTSAALTMNENASPDVRADMEAFFDSIAPEDDPGYRHTLEGPDDMPAHIKASLLGSSVTVPIVEGRLALGTWQGIYLCEFRNDGGPRTLVLTVAGGG